MLSVRSEDRIEARIVSAESTDQSASETRSASAAVSSEFASTAAGDNCVWALTSVEEEEPHPASIAVARAGTRNKDKIL